MLPNNFFYLHDQVWSSNWSSNDGNNLISEIINHSHIKKAIFVYNTSRRDKKFIRKFEGVTHAQKELHINHDVIKKICVTKYTV